MASFFSINDRKEAGQRKLPHLGCSHAQPNNQLNSNSIVFCFWKNFLLCQFFLGGWGGGSNVSSSVKIYTPVNEK